MIIVSESTLERIKKVFLDGNTASEKYLTLTEYGKRKMLEELLSNATFKNKNIVNYQFKSIYSVLANTPKNCDLPTLLCSPVWYRVMLDSISLFGTIKKRPMDALWSEPIYRKLHSMRHFYGLSSVISASSEIFKFSKSSSILHKLEV